jgi:hypothetical protein
VEIGTNFALSDEGASPVEKGYSSQTYIPVKPETSVLQRLSNKLIASFDVDNGVGTYSDALSLSMTPGDCWPMNGSKGTLTIKLRKPIKIGAFSIGHVLKREAIDISTAPKDFSVYGRNRIEDEPRLLFENKNYDVLLNKRQQYYWYSDKESSITEDCRCPLSEAIQFVTFNVKSNYGHSHFTCIYNIGIYGVESN